MDGENDPTGPASEHLMPCPLFTETSWHKLELHECCPASAPPSTPQPKRIPLDAFAIGGHRYQYVPRTSNEEHYHFEAVYGAVDQYLVTKVLLEWDTVTRMPRRDKEAEHHKRQYGVGPENAGYEGNSTASILAVAQIPLCIRRTSAYAQVPRPNSRTTSPKKSLTRTCWTYATSSTERPISSNPRELAESPLGHATSSVSVRPTATQARTPRRGHAQSTADPAIAPKAANPQEESKNQADSTASTDGAWQEEREVGNTA